LLCNFPKYPVTSFLFGPHILLSTLFLNTLRLYFMMGMEIVEWWRQLFSKRSALHSVCYIFPSEAFWVYIYENFLLKYI
jgi:hypothetical protein